MIYQAADSCIHISGSHGTHQFKSYIDHIYIRSVCSHIFHHTFYKSFTQNRSAITDGLTNQIFRFGDIFVFQRQDHVQRRLYDRANRFNSCSLISNGLDHILLIVHTDLCFSCCYQCQRIVIICRKMNLHIQSLFCKISTLNGSIQECMDGIGIPVQNYVDFS